MNSPHRKANEPSVRKYSGLFSISIFCVGIVVLVGCLFYLLNRVHIIENKMVTQHDIIKINEFKRTGIDRQQLNLLEQKFDTSATESLKFSSLVIAAMGLFFSIVTILIIPVVAYFYKQSSNLYKQSAEVNKQSSNISKDVNDAMNKVHSLLEINSTIQKELSRVNTIQYTNIEKYLSHIAADDLREFLSLFILSIQQADSYRWCLENSLSMDKDLRRRALQNIAAHQNSIQTAKDYMISLINHFEGPEFEDDRNIIMLGLGIK